MLVISGGRDKNKDTLDDCWIFNITQHSWIKLDVPQSVNKRLGHSLSVFIMSPHCVWIITTGGYVDMRRTFVTNPNIVMLTELVTNSKGEWTVGDTLDTNGMNDEEYKKKYQQQLQTGRRIWLEEYQKPRKGDTADIEQTVQALMKSLEEKKREAQVYHQQLEQKEREEAEKEQEIRRYRHQLQEKDREHQLVLHEKDRELQKKEETLRQKDIVILEKDKELHQSEESVRRYQQQALTDDHWVINKDEVTLVNSIQEWKNIAEENKKLKANVTILTKEKSRLEERNDDSTEEIEKLKAKVVDDDMVIAKLTKEKLQLKEELQSMEDISTDTKSIQCDYWTKAELPFDGMVTLGKKVCLYNANSSHELELDECGLSLSLPDGLFSPVDSTVYEAAAQGLWGGDFEFPGDTHLISSVCYISVSPTAPELDKPVTVQLVHCAHLSSESQSKYLSFVVAKVQPGKKYGPFKFELLPGGSFSPESQTGTIELKSFSLVAIVMGGATLGGAAGVAAAIAVDHQI
ncbi:PREDICTED: uncharacterized protein LOC109588978 [Amphimedon queenslandica]|uniref:ZU5 domain-containing protein n=1 Tax=Amphimedon queenslandica TaxID=400682 RepID=A0AAN0JUR8_AMPQE|nr:PREDICTED: uncharacterized protein LOC109588978 [Amphimedon queenslandica]|eukprot:XP_019860647.1 PREDICTED: uncharacterized protein LOC109588978 [Amphimedon queenslandica]